LGVAVLDARFRGEVWLLSMRVYTTVDIQEHELASYRDYINKREPSLAHKAGKHFKEFTRPRPEVAEIITRKKPVVVRPIMKPEPDLRKLATAFVKLAKHLKSDD
jgi:hypothetical protein